ncbi:MAG: ABC transporter ATP-binding protein [Anaerolineales bacterium]|nr:ABC transporter ATP-binding protein [Anaerolineales bacterium]
MSKSKTTPIIQVKNVIKRFAVGDDKITVLKGVSFDAYPGEFACIVGPSGNGKSTLLNMITGIDHPSEGEVIVTGQPVHTMSENELAAWRGRNVGIIFQFFQMLPSLNLLQNVILPMDFVKKLTPKERRERAMHLLDIVGLADQAYKLPSMVSGGQQQRAAIARALANDPPLLLADEPTGNLDSKTEEAVFTLFEELVAQGKTLMMVTHSRSLAARIPRMIEIRDGRISNDTGTRRREGETRGHGDAEHPLPFTIHNS